MPYQALTHRLRSLPSALAAAALYGLPLLASAQAQAQAANAPKVQEIVISAQKHTERLKDTPVAASVLSEDALAKSNANDISDINMLVPSVL